MLRKFNIILIVLVNITTLTSAQNKILQQVENYIYTEPSTVLFISIENQELYYIRNKTVVNTFIISSSKYGTGNKNGSNKTPLGIHKVKEKHGEDTPLNGIMVGRIFNGKIAKVYHDTTRSKTDDITTRILWLEGMEEGKNKGIGIDSYKRYIYIHGTSEEGRLGMPASHGCIRMKNKDIIDLYRIIEVGTLVLIL